MELSYDLKATGPGVFALCGRLFFMSGSCVSLKGEDALVIAAVIAAGRKKATGRAARRVRLVSMGDCPFLGGGLWGPGRDPQAVLRLPLRVRLLAVWRLAVRLLRRTLLALRLPRIPRRLIAHEALPTRRRRPRSPTSENASKVPVMRGNCEPDISP
jgi:hypothetical protein